MSKKQIMSRGNHVDEAQAQHNIAKWCKVGIMENFNLPDSNDHTIFTSSLKDSKLAKFVLKNAKIAKFVILYK